MMKLIKKCKPGGWINKNKHIWDYSDSPDPDIQKKIATYYTNWSSDEQDSKVRNYLNTHPELADYLDKAYQKGIDWDGQKKLGNAPDLHTVNYRNSEGDVKITDEGEEYAKSLGYQDYNALNEALKRAGFEITGKGQFYTGNQYLLAKTPKGVAFVNNGTNKVAKLNKKILDELAKKRAPISKAYHAWDKIAELYRKTHNGGWFSSAMARNGYKYDWGTGTYKKGNETIKIDSGNVIKYQGANSLTEFTYNSFVQSLK